MHLLMNQNSYQQTFFTSFFVSIELQSGSLIGKSIDNSISNYIRVPSEESIEHFISMSMNKSFHESISAPII